MRFDNLQLVAFGPFSGKVLEFCPEKKGLVICVGPNEAGKSTALRALSHLLFGIPMRTPDDFLHAKPNLRIGATLSLDDGSTLDLLRRKGRGLTLIDPETKAPLAVDPLAPILGALDEDSFRSFWGIDHDALVAGGAQLAVGEGDLGRALFEAGLGHGALQPLQAALDEEAKCLFAARGANPAVNKALARLKELKRELRSSLLDPKEWQSLVKERERVDEAIRALDADRSEQEVEHQRVQRVLRVLPLLDVLASLEAELAPYASLPRLGTDFPERRRATLDELTRLVSDEDRQSERLEELRKRRGALVVPEELVSRSAAVKDLDERRGSIRKARRDMLRIRGQRDASHNAAKDLIGRIRAGLSLGDADKLLAQLERQGRVRTLSEERAALDERLATAQRSEAKATRALNQATDALQALPAPDNIRPLEMALASHQQSGDLFAEIKRLSQALETKEERVARDARQLDLQGLSPEALGSLSVPQPENVKSFEARLSLLEGRRRDLERERDEVKRGLDGNRLNQRRFAAAGAVPTEEQLVARRSGRDALWQSIRRSFVEGAALPDDGTPPQVARDFEGDLHGSDAIVDRMRQDAQRVHEFATLTHEAERLGAREIALEGALKELGDKEALALGEWRALWAATPVQPRTPPEMAAWLGRFELLLRGVDEARQQRKDLAARVDLLQRHLGTLHEALAAHEGAAAGPTPPSVDDREGAMHAVAQAQLLIRDAGALEKKRDKLDNERARARETLAEILEERPRLDSALQDWQGRWAATVAELGLGPDATAGEAEDSLRRISELQKHLADKASAGRRLYGMEKDAEEFAADLEALVDGLEQRPAGDDALDVVQRLAQALLQAEGDRKDRDRLDQEVTALQRELARTKTALARERNTLSELLAEADTESADGFAEVERLVARRDDLERRMREVEVRLGEAAPGMSVQSLRDEVADANADSLRAEADRLDEAIGEARRTRDGHLTQRGQLEERLRSSEGGSSRGAELADEQAALVAKLKDDARAYARLHLARQLLDREVERYRERHQNPLLLRASAAFARLTRGHFVGVRVDGGNDGEAHLVCLRDGQAEVEVTGLSEGTRDQLYLALRLATLEERLAAAGSSRVPFIVDDILVNFDEDRTRATLELLHELADKTQVLLFTHHRFVVDLAREALGDGMTVVEI